MTVDYPEIYRDENVFVNSFGYQIPDPYRWLEDPDSNETKEFVSNQNKITNSYMDSCPLKDKFSQRLKQMWDYERFSCPFKSGNHFYYWRNSGLQNQSVLYQLESLDGSPKLFLDPNSIDVDGLASIKTYAFSEDGQYFCYGLSHGGSDWFELRFKRTDTFEELDDVLKNVKFSGIEWTHDGLGIFYCMYRDHQGKADGTETTSNKDQKLMYHRLGTPQSQDILCVERPDNPSWIIGSEVSVCGRYVLVTFHDGCEPNNLLYYCDLSDWNYQVSGPLTLIPIVDKFEAMFEYVTNIDNDFIFRTNSNAPMYKLIKINLQMLDQSNWTDVIEHQSKVLLEDAKCVHQDYLLISQLKDVKSCLSIHSLRTGAKLTDLPLPLGSVDSMHGRKRDSLAFMKFSSFLTPGEIYLCDFEHQPFSLTLFRRSVLPGVDLSNFTTKQVFYQSKDQKIIPMFIVGPQDMILDSSRPCRLYGYGGFNISITPYFSISPLLLLLHFGGIFAFANIRGGGEYGQLWHDGGRRQHKQNSFDDFQAAAEYLIREGYTCREKLYLTGGSNGGLLVCACANQRPDLFSAVIAHVPVCDLIRFHKFTIGHAWTSDYGDPENEEDFKLLLRYSPLHNVKRPVSSNVQYPATLVLTADHDDRVVPLHSFKFISTLQHTLCQQNSSQTNPILIRIETKAGHGAGKPTSKTIDEIVDTYAFLHSALRLTWSD